MAGTGQNVREGLTLEEFLRLPEQKPYLQYIDGRIEAKVSPKRKHSAIQLELAKSLDNFARRKNLGRAFPELRCTFAGRAIIPDIVFQLAHQIDWDEEGELADDTFVPPDIHVEIVSPDQSPRDLLENLNFSLVHGCTLGWLIDPYEKTVTVYRPGRDPETLGPKGKLDGAEVLPGFKLPVARIFGWIKR